MGSLIDASIFIAAERGDLALRSALALLVPDEGDIFHSAVTVFELLHGVHRATPQKRAVREAYVESALRIFPTLAFDEPAARILASVDSALAATGNKLAIEDLMIGATALAGGHEVVTRDLRSFPRIPGLQMDQVVGRQKPETGLAGFDLRLHRRVPAHVGESSHGGRRPDRRRAHAYLAP